MISFLFFLSRSLKFSPFSDTVIMIYSPLKRRYFRHFLEGVALSRRVMSARMNHGTVIERCSARSQWTARVKARGFRALWPNSSGPAFLPWKSSGLRFTTLVRETLF
ncbi:hypothetical protein QQP08_009089 [Theobroma cacao]|uniref:Uncharacterized protein n=1 Tax=Theobroma cacao TaxID=3641 RepID=A0A061E3N2_THECC|nr:Uncharacterized protein TCM_006026 [Theobroma cacao]WRX16602.1 hypothetical protein QQP08_009089 [Theobroma cacao]